MINRFCRSKESLGSYYSFIAAGTFWYHKQVQTRRSFGDTIPEVQKEPAEIILECLNPGWISTKVT